MDTTVLILGGTGMLGHQLWLTFKNSFNTFVTLRNGPEQYEHLKLFDTDHTFYNTDTESRKKLQKIFAKIKPDVVINCIGIIKQLPQIKDPIVSIKVNALFPHELENMANQFGTKLIHISTDCVFSGKKGNYTEQDNPDAEDFYGKTKFLGEVSKIPSLTLRTSIIGRELHNRLGLVEWFLARKPKEIIKGYTHAIFSGLTTKAVAKTISWLITEHPNLSGLYHLASQPITKYDLLKRLQNAFNLDIRLAPFEDFYCDRSLDGTGFNQATVFSPPSWEEMIQGLKKEDSFYREVLNANDR